MWVCTVHVCMYDVYVLEIVPYVGMGEASGRGE